MTLDNIDDIMQQIYDEFGAPDLGPNEFTGSMFCKRFGLPRSRGESQIRRAVEAGKLVSVGKRLTPGGKIVNAYRIA